MRRHSENVVQVIPPAGAPGANPAGDPWPARWTAEAVIQVLDPLVTDARRDRLRKVLGARLGSVTVVMDAPHDPHNGGAVLRSADAFGLREIHVVARNEPFAISTTVTRGSEKWVDVLVHASPDDAVGALSALGFELVGTHPGGELLPEDLVRIPRLALVLGNEHDGICAALARAAARAVRVPMRGFVESLNVSVSAAVLLDAATRGRPGDLSESDRERLYARGLYRSVPRADRVLAARRHK